MNELSSWIKQMKKKQTQFIDYSSFSGMRVTIASPKYIRDISSGEVKKAETINYRTFKPETDGLFCEKIFGPTKDWECRCGKYKEKWSRLKNTVCDRCGVEVTESKVRRERMGHVELAEPVTHIWYLKKAPSRISIVMNMKVNDLSAVVYFTKYIVLSNNCLEPRFEALKKNLRALVEAKTKKDREQEEELLKTISRDYRAVFESDFKMKSVKVIEDFLIDFESTVEKLPLVKKCILEPDEKELMSPEYCASSPIVTAYAGKPAEEKDAALYFENKGLREQYKVLSSFLKKDINDSRRKINSSKVITAFCDAARRLCYYVNSGLDNFEKDAGKNIEEALHHVNECLHEDPSTVGGFLELMKHVRALLDIIRISSKKKIEDLEFFPEMDIFLSGYSRYVTIDMGSGAVRKILSLINLEEAAKAIKKRIDKTANVSIKNRLVKNWRTFDGLLKSTYDPEDKKSHADWMILTVLPVLPPELRPLVPLEGGRFATSDLNDLYRRVINRNNMLKGMRDHGAPDIMIHSQKRMLQEAVDALFEVTNKSKRTTAVGARPLKSLSEILRGKQGRFRQNLLGKRVDYSGRSVIVVGPHLKLNQCGLPKGMALELFKPFVIRELISRGNNQSNAKKMFHRVKPEVWDILEKVTKNHPVLLNRAPTLHRLSIQAFYPILIEGKAIQLHPLVCAAFNADFDGDQMAVHIPISPEAILEARYLMLSTNNILSPAHGKPITVMSQDMVLGLCYLTTEKPGDVGEWNDRVRKHQCFSSFDEVQTAVDAGALGLNAKIKFIFNSEVIETTAGRVIFNSHLPDEIRFINRQMTKKHLAELISNTYRDHGRILAVLTLDILKSLGFNFITKIGVTISIEDMKIPESKTKIIAAAKNEISSIKKQLSKGFITEQERYHKVIDTWTAATYDISRDMLAALKNQGGENFNPGVDKFNSIYMMATSGARGNIDQVRQLGGIRGLMSKPQKKITGGTGEIIETPIVSNFREGLSVLEYFISTHGGRKGLADTALKTAEAGYLTRRLVDVCHDIVITLPDCGTVNGIKIRALTEGENEIESFAERVLGRFSVDNIAGEFTKKDLFELIRSGVFSVADSRFAAMVTGEEPTVLNTEADFIFLIGSGALDKSDMEKLLETKGLSKEIEKGLKKALANYDSIREGSPDFAGILKSAENEMVTARIIEDDSLVTHKDLPLIEKAGVNVMRIRSILTCEAGSGVCQKCYGVNLATGSLVEVGESVGILAAQSIGEPGTQLTLRTFHIGGTAAKMLESYKIEAAYDGTVRFNDLKTIKRERKTAEGSVKETINMSRNAVVTVKSSAVREKQFFPVPFGAVVNVADGEQIKKGTLLVEWDPYSKPIIANESGKIKYHGIVEGKTLRTERNKITAREEHIVIECKSEKLAPRIIVRTDSGKTEEYTIPIDSYIVVEEGQSVSKGDIIAKIPSEVSRTKDITGGLPRVQELFEARKPKNAAMISEVEGSVRLGVNDAGQNTVQIESENYRTKPIVIPRGKHLIVYDGDRVQAGSPLTDGAVNPHDILRVKGEKEVQEYLVNEIQEVYRLQGVTVTDKHIEIIVRQMLSNVVIDDSGDSGLIVGERVNKYQFRKMADLLTAQKKRPPLAHTVLLGITRAALSSESFLSAASFQETIKVLSEACVMGETDPLKGLKENVIVGHLIPAGTGLSTLSGVPPANAAGEKLFPVKVAK